MSDSVMPTIGFIGAGRLAQGLAPALCDAGHTVAAIWSRDRTRSARLADQVAGCEIASSG
jgi:3-hydroxyisobutyrate dehydrogenase-like beta-hydroxyacid dehydrogenase